MTDKKSSQSIVGIPDSKTKRTRDPVAHIRVWLQSMHAGCKFAGQLAVAPKGSDRSPDLVVASDLPAEHFSSFFQSCAAEEKPAMVVLPKIRTEEELVEFLLLLREQDDWSCETIQVEKYPFPDALVQIRWKAPHGWQSEVMGLAPFSRMPVTRRAPFVVLAMWPELPANDEDRLYPRKEHGVMEFLDTRHSFSEEEIDKYKAESLRVTKELFSSPPLDDKEFYRQVAFVLPASVAEALTKQA